MLIPSDADTFNGGVKTHKKDYIAYIILYKHMRAT
jgi:hypothetical protein